MQEVVAERFDGVEYCTFFMGKLILPVDRSWRVIPQNDRQSAKIIICKLESSPIQFGNLVAWKPEKIANFSTFRVTYDCRKQRNVDEMIPENDRQNTYTPKILKYSWTHMHCESPAFGTTPVCVHQMHVYVDFFRFPCHQISKLARNGFKLAYNHVRTPAVI